jgi:protein-tyrosine phosphatase
LYWIEGSFPGRIAIVPRPRGGDWLERDLRLLRKEGIDVLVSLLTPDEIADFELRQEPEQSRQRGIEFETFPIVDRGVPKSREAFAELAHRLATKVELGQKVGIHCRQGIGRSSLLAAAVLVAVGIDWMDALRTVSEARGIKVPETAEQLRWFEEYARTQPAMGPR